MANRTNTATKSKTAALATAVAFAVPEIRQNKGNSTLLKLIDKAITGFKSVVQSIEQAEPLIHEAAVAAAKHCEAHGDAMPADRLMKGLMALNHPSATAAARELMAWFRANSPIRWDARSPYKVSVLKEGQDGYKPFDAAKLEAVPFNETPQAKRARDMANAAHKNSLKDADLPMMVARAKGVINFLNNIIEGKDDRKIKAGEAPKMQRFAKKMNEVLKEFGGEEAVVPVAKVA